MLVVKICGVVSARELDLLRDCGVDLVGVWHAVAGGARDLPLARAAALIARAARAARPRPVLVTTLAEESRLREAIERTGARWVQLHGWQSPGLVRRLKADRGLTVVKVLHVRNGRCPEVRLIPAYERAGTDLFLLDAMAADGRVGSTGEVVGEPSVLALAARCRRPFLLAGGVSPGTRAAYPAAVRHPLFRGVDVDTAARDERGRLDARRISDLIAAWRPPPPVPDPTAAR